MTIEIWADGANLESMIKLNESPFIKGFTTNPTLMWQAGVKDYKQFIKDVVANIKGKPVSFEVFSDDLNTMEVEANRISEMGENIYVKIPVMLTSRQPTYTLIQQLARAGVKLNVTAVFTTGQIEVVNEALGYNGGIISIFAGRIMDAGFDARIQVGWAADIKYPKVKVLWASTRELYNIVQAEEARADIITIPNDILKKVDSIGKDLTDFSWETVCMFHNDIGKLGFKSVL